MGVVGCVDVRVINLDWGAYYSVYMLRRSCTLTRSDNKYDNKNFNAIVKDYNWETSARRSNKIESQVP